MVNYLTNLISLLIKLICLMIFYGSWYFILALIWYLFAGYIDHPHHNFSFEPWFSHRYEQSLTYAWSVTALIVAVIPIDLMIQKSINSEECDLVYMPRFHRCLDWFRKTESRWIIILTLAYLFYYLAESYITQYRLRVWSGSTVWPPERIVYSIVVLWGGVWFADCVGRVKGGTFFAALVFFCFARYIAFPLEGFLRE